MIHLCTLSLYDCWLGVVLTEGMCSWEHTPRHLELPCPDRLVAGTAAPPQVATTMLVILVPLQPNATALCAPFPGDRAAPPHQPAPAAAPCRRAHTGPAAHSGSPTPRRRPRPRAHSARRPSPRPPHAAVAACIVIITTQPWATYRACQVHALCSFDACAAVKAMAASGARHICTLHPTCRLTSVKR